MPRVSVVIPTYNREALLHRAISSVAAQTFPDWEALIVDDASRDGTADMVRRMADPRVRYLRHDSNLGVGAARNTALARASSEFVAFLDDDDEWLPEKLRIQVDCFEHVQPSVGLICSGHYVEDDGTSRKASEVVPTLRGRVFEPLLRQGYLGQTSTVMARAECFGKVGVFDATLRYAEDLDMWLRIAREYEVDYVPKPLVRRHFQADGYNQNYEAMVSGTEAHLAKYRDFFESNPDVLNTRLQKLALNYCLAGRTKQGRRTFYRAASHGRLTVNSYLCIGLSLLGPRGFRSCLAAREALQLKAKRLSRG